ncbi:MAG: hypothetical protein ACI8PZ_001938 [Myxococcota bacterium]|jgi:hypothetical protein
MIHALGYSHNEFDLSRPGRLCRGRERWIEPWELPPGLAPVHRLVISGAAFDDDSARDALRGVVHSKVDFATLLGALFPRKVMLAFMEDGHPADIPAEAEGIEAYDGYRAGGMVSLGLVRWHMKTSGVRAMRAVIGEDPDERVRGFLVLDGDDSIDGLAPELFPLVGMSTLDSPPARYNPAALAQLVDLCRAVVLFHRDKHGCAIGVYSRLPVKTEGRLQGLCDKAGSLLVPFAIPPMLARWDRALSELREEWLATRADDFPVPPAAEPTPWSRREVDAQPPAEE